MVYGFDMAELGDNKSNGWHVIVVPHLSSD